MYRTGNYCAFYVEDDTLGNNLGIFSSSDIRYYEMLKAWKEKDSSFPFVNSHDKTYSVKDDSDWEKTLKPRLHQRLNASKNIILILTSSTKNSRALREEIDYGCNTLGLPLIIVYPEMSKTDIGDKENLSPKVMKLWSNLPVLKKALENVPSLHVPFDKELIRSALSNHDFTVQSPTYIAYYWF